MRDFEKIVQFSCSRLSQTEHFLQRIIFLLHSSIPYTLYNSHCSHFSRNYSSSDCKPFPWNYSSCLWLLVSSSGWLANYENRRLLVEGKISWEFWLAFLSVKPGWVLMDGWMDAVVKACHFNGLFSIIWTNIYILVVTWQFCTLSLTYQWKRSITFYVWTHVNQVS